MLFVYSLNLKPKYGEMKRIFADKRRDLGIIQRERKEESKNGVFSKLYDQAEIYYGFLQKLILRLFAYLSLRRFKKRRNNAGSGIRQNALFFILWIIEFCIR